MSNLYLHKVKKYMFRTIKDTIVFDLDKVKYGYEYEKNFLQKHPKHLKIVGSNLVDFWKYDFHFWSFPVEDIILCTNLVTYARPFYGFYNATDLKVEENVKKVRMIDTLGLNGIQTITIPFSISDFKNNCSTIRNKLKTLIIYNDNNSLEIDLDKNFFGKEIIIEANNMGDYLNIKTSNDNNIIEYSVYLKDDKLSYDKKYLKYQINASEYDSDTEELNIIELKEKYNEISFKGYFFYVRKVILNKDDMHYLTSDLFRYLKDIKIKEENDMSLLPRNIHISLDKEEYEFMEEIEMLKDNLLIKTNNSSEDNKYIIINNDLSVINIEKDNLDRIVIDYDRNNFHQENNTLIISDKIFRASKKSKILNEVIKKSKYLDDVKVSINGKIYSINLKEVFNSEISDTDRIKQYRKSIEKKRIYRKGKHYE